MAKKATPPETESPKGDGESIQGYFRRIFKEKPKLLRERSNKPLLDRWLADHPGEKEVPKSRQIRTGQSEECSA